jgi:hypothetical protein
MGESRVAYRVSVENCGAESTWKPTRRLEDNIKMDLQDVDCVGRGYRLD